MEGVINQLEATPERGPDARAVRVLAHPLRSRLLGALRLHGPSTATELAKRLGTNSGATSYHLRRLADVGLIDDDPDDDPGDDPALDAASSPRRNRRERRWRTSPQRHQLRRCDVAHDEDAATALAWLERDYVRHFAERAERWLDASSDWPATWVDELGLSDSLALVDLDQLLALRGELQSVLRKFARLGQGNPKARRIAVYTCMFPIDLDRPPGHFNTRR